MLKKILNFYDVNVQEIPLNVVLRNSYFAHPENILLATLGNDNEDICSMGISKVLCLRKNVKESIDSDKSSIRLFEVPQLNLKAVSYYKLVDEEIYLQQPPAIAHLTDAEIEDCKMIPLHLNHPWHNQAVERHVKMVTEASSEVAKYEGKDGLIKQKIKSRKLMKQCNTKMHFK